VKKEGNKWWQPRTDGGKRRWKGDLGSLLNKRSETTSGNRRAGTCLKGKEVGDKEREGGESSSTPTEKKYEKNRRKDS